jgi:hypothetical protein
MADHCTCCGGVLSTCEACGTALGMRGPRRNIYCNAKCRAAAINKRYTHLRELGYTCAQAQRGRCSGNYQRMVREKLKCIANASAHQATQGSG